MIIAASHDQTESTMGTGAFRAPRQADVGEGHAHPGTWVARRRVGLARAAKLNAATVTALPLADGIDGALGHRAPWFRAWLSTPDRSDPLWEGCNASAALDNVSVPIRLVSGWRT